MTVCLFEGAGTARDGACFQSLTRSWRQINNGDDTARHSGTIWAAFMEATHIVKTPGICGGKACINGHRIRVMDIVVWHEMRNYAAEEIIAMFPGITLADVYAALTYYFDNREEIEADFAENEALAKELLKEYPSKVPGKRSA
jgi:uncharacterized protein (DUF433 family)